MDAIKNKRKYIVCLYMIIFAFIIYNLSYPMNV